MRIDSSPVAERNGVPQKELSFLNDTNGECTLVQMEKDNLELRRELQDALANNKQAGKKIQKWVSRKMRANGRAKIGRREEYAWLAITWCYLSHIWAELKLAHFVHPIASLEYQLQSLQKAQLNVADTNNVVTISTSQPSPPHSNNNLSHHEDFNNPTKIQFNEQSAKVTANGRRTSTVNLIGPVTDL